MIMKNIMKSSVIVVILLIACSFIMACDFNNKKEEGPIPAGDGGDGDMMMQEDGQTHDNMQNTMQMEDWNSYKNESGIRLQNNEKLIAELRSTNQIPENVSDIQFDKMLADLELKNKVCQEKMANYSYSTDSHLTEFKSEFNQDLDELETSISNLNNENKD
jgi:hypothetical protein